MSTDTVLVTGASADIGLALLDRLAKRGDVRVIAHCHTGHGRLPSARDRLAGRYMALEADLSDRDACDAFARRVADTQWPVTHFVHLPALPLVYERFTKFDWTRFLRDVELQVGSLVRLLPHWLPRPHAGGARLGAGLRNIVVVSSSVTLGVPPKYLSMYSAVKYAQLAIVRTLAAEYAELEVKVNTLSPSMVDTRFLANVPRTVVEKSASSNPNKRNATADEVAAAIEWLLFAPTLLSGVNLPLTGGA
jgi:3-oxoacyl-[acyl-carrier protein] reductase